MALWHHGKELWRLRWQLLATHAVESTAAFLLITPVIAGVIRIAVAASGQAALADQDIAMFVLTPLGAIAAILVASVVLTGTVLETAVMMEVVAAERSGARRWGLTALRAVAARLPRLAFFAAHCALRMLALALPPLGLAGAILWLRLGAHDINYYLDLRPPEFTRTLWMILPLVIGAAALVGERLIAWSLALPLVLFDHARPHAAFAQSATMTHGHRLAIARDALLCIALGFGMGLLVTAFAGALRFAAGLASSGSLAELVGLLGVVLLVWALLLTLTGAVTQGVLVLFMLQWLERLGGRPAHEPDEGPAAPPTGRTAQLAAIGGLAIVTAFLSGVTLLRGLDTIEDAQIIGHRGAAGLAPENTLAAIDAAIAAGADWVEIDVQESADGEVIVVHDRDFMRVAGDPMQVSEATRARIDALDVGRGFDGRFTGEHVPRLTEVLDRARDRVRVLIELKYSGHDDPLVEHVAEIVGRAGMDGQIAVMSFEADEIARVRMLRPDWLVGLLVATALGDLTRLDVDFLAVSAGMATPAFLRRARDAGMPVYVWTVNDPVTVSQMVSRGASGIITHYPDMAREVLAARDRMTTVERLLVELADLLGIGLDVTVRTDAQG
jgi:glycerophosphoryl diester phosphodiesterase